MGAFCCSKIIKKLIVKHEVKMKFINLGFVIASPAVVIRKCIIDNPNYAATYSNTKLVIGIIPAVVVFLAMIIFYHFASPDNKDSAHSAAETTAGLIASRPLMGGFSFTSLRVRRGTKLY